MAFADAMQSVDATAGKEWLGDYVLGFLQSSSWTDPIEMFLREHFSAFNLSNLDENKLEYTNLHKDFNNLIESLLAAHLLDVDVSPDEFAEVFEACCWTDARLGPVAAQLASVDDFLVFKRMMMGRYQSETSTRVYSPPDIPANQPMSNSDVEVEQAKLRSDSVRFLLSQMLSSNGRRELQKAVDPVTPPTTALVPANELLPPVPSEAPSVKETNRLAAIVANATQTTADHKEQADINSKAGIGHFFFAPASRAGA